MTFSLWQGEKSKKSEGDTNPKSRFVSFSIIAKWTHNGSESTTADELNKALFSIATVDLLDPVRPIRHGTFNTRPINKAALHNLVQIMESAGVHSNLYSTAIPILASPEHIDPSSIFTDITKINQAPELKLSEKGELEVEKFFAAGGNHRTAAIGVLNERLESRIEQLESEIKTKEEKNSNKSKSKARLEELRQELGTLKAKKGELGKWTVLLYDEGKWKPSNSSNMEP